MKLISRREFEELSSEKDDLCISIYIPTHKSGQAVTQQKDVILLRTQLQEIKRKLQELGLNARETEKMTESIGPLLDDSEFWRHREKGLAIFASESGIHTYALPIHFDPENHVSRGFFLKPLLPLFTFEGEFLVLTLELKGVHLYRGTKHGIEEVALGSEIPERLEDVVGYDYEQKSLQHKTQQAGRSAQAGGRASFHGHGEGKEDRKNEILTYFRAIDNGLAPELRDSRTPMVIVCLDYLFPIYQEANTYNHLHDEHISGNPQDMSIRELHDRAWHLIQPLFKEESKEKKALFRQLHGTGRTSANMHEVLPAAVAGRIDTLFLRKGADIRGTYDLENNQVEVDENGKELRNSSLTNKAAIEVFLQGGNVYLLEEDEMPDAHSEVNALYRY